MEKAKTIKELANNLNPMKPLNKEKDAEAYVPIFEDKLADLRDGVLNDANYSQTYFVAGQSGTGKTTALNFISTSEIEKEYKIIDIGTRELLDPLDIDIIDLLLIIAYKIVEGTPLLVQYFDELQRLKKIYEGLLEEEIIKCTEEQSAKGSSIGASANLALLKSVDLKAEYFKNYKTESTYRKAAREIFKLKKPELLKIVNNLIENRKDTDSRSLLLIIDDLDKLRDPEQMNALFISDRFYYLGINCKKILAIPVHLTTNPELTNLGSIILKFTFRFIANPLDPSENDKEIIKKNKDIFKKALFNRIDDVSLIDSCDDDAAIEEAIKYSGGIIRQFIQIFYNASTSVRRHGGSKITKEDIIKGWRSIKEIMDGQVISDRKIQLLDSVNKEHKPNFDEDAVFIEALLGNQIIAYSNGTTWYEVNPIIEKTVEIYASKKG